MLRADRLYLSERAAGDAGKRAVTDKKADRFKVVRRHTRNEDRSWDFGFVAILIKGDRPVGFA